MKHRIKYLLLSILIITSASANAVVMQGETSAGVYTNVATDANGKLTTTISGTITGLPTALGSTTAANSLPVVLPSSVTVTGPAAQSAASTDLLTGNSTAGASGWYDAKDLHSGSIQIIASSGISSGQITFEQTNDSTSAVAGVAIPTIGAQSISGGVFAGAFSVTASTNSIYNFSITSRYIRARISTAFVGGTVQAVGVFSPLQMTPGINTAVVLGTVTHSTASSGAPVRAAGRVNTAVDTTLISGDVSDLFMTTGGAHIVKSYAVPEVDWQYAAASGGISNTTTAVTMQNAGASGVRNYVTSCQLSSDALGAASELAIRDGAGGTVLWRSKIGTAGLVGGELVTFPTPLRGTAATLVEVVTLTASITGAVYVNCQGYQAP